ncbi:MAG TPA: hypothetical protein VH391_05280 [Solirubrobacterales bacterium]
MALVVLLTPVVAHGAKPGDLDRSFSRNGKAMTDFGASDSANAVAIDARDRSVVAGYDYSATEDEYLFALARYRRSGKLDRSFSADGRVETKFGDAYGDAATSVAVDSQGRIVAAGSLNPDFPDGFALARYLPDGSLDPSFGDHGTVTLSFGGREQQANAMAVDSQDRIVLAGSVLRAPPPTWSSAWALARYLPDGSLDDSFGSAGKLTTDFGTPFDEARSVMIDSDDRIVAAGRRALGGEGGRYFGAFGLVRYTSTGALDPSFGTSGEVATEPRERDAEPTAAAIDAHGRIVVAGLDGPGFTLVRYEPDGRIDSAFGVGGHVTTRFGNANATPSSVTVDSRGRIIAAGTVSRRHRSSDFAVARYRGDGSLDRSFSGNGKANTDFGGRGRDLDGARSVAVDSQNRIVAAGSDTGDFAVARYIGYRDR